MIYILLFSFMTNAEWCDLKDKSGKVLHTYEGACGTQKFGGPWSDAQQVPNTARQKEEDDKKVEREKKEKDRGDRRKRLEQACASADAGLLKELCDEVLDAR